MGVVVCRGPAKASETKESAQTTSELKLYMVDDSE